MRKTLAAGMAAVVALTLAGCSDEREEQCLAAVSAEVDIDSGKRHKSKDVRPPAAPARPKSGGEK